MSQVGDARTFLLQRAAGSANLADCAMFIQHVLKGMQLGSDADADEILAEGIYSSWWRTVHQISPADIRRKLSDRNLSWHLSHFDRIDPQTSAPFRDQTPFISTTAGSVARDFRAARNLTLPALTTALWFATDQFRGGGYLFDAYLFTLGKKGVELQEFAEETRELNIYTRYQRHHAEGEIVAKVHIPSMRIRRWRYFDGPTAKGDLVSGVRPRALRSKINAGYIEPDQYANIRGVTV